MQIPRIGEKLQKDQEDFLKIFDKDCRWMILEMLKKAQSGHPGGSLSSIDFLTVLYAAIISRTGEKIVISNGHITPAVYSVLAELGYVDRTALLSTFRAVGSIFEGHVARCVPGVWYGTGPLGIGLSVACGFALTEKMQKTGRKVFGVLGDGEADEGQVYEMMNFAAKNQLNNLIVFCDANGVQLTDALEKVMPVNITGHFQAAGWRVIEVDGHDYQDIWRGISEAYDGTAEAAGVTDDRPVLIMAKTVMGKGVDFMEAEGLAHRATWHGKAPSAEQVEKVIGNFILSAEERRMLDEFAAQVKWKPEMPVLEWPEKNNLNPGKPTLYPVTELTDCRTAYGKALKDLADLNPQILALTADLGGSVMTKFLAEAYPDRHLECGISEQHMMSLAGGLSLAGFVPFVSTFGVFMTSRAKDQARVNDINNTNVKMVATHCGLSVGEDGPTHQAIDDAGSFLGLFNTRVIEPADPNHTDRVIRHITTHDGNFYVRMGRHKIPVITAEDGQPFYGTDYLYEYGRTDLLREGSSMTVVAVGSMAHEVLEAWKKMAAGGKRFELIIASSIKQFDQTLADSIKKTGRVVTVEDHNAKSGLHSQVASFILEQGLKVDLFEALAVSSYQRSGKYEDLYAAAGLDSENVLKYLDKII
jgi:transketolase